MRYLLRSAVLLLACACGRQAVSDQVTCGAGTSLVGTECVPAGGLSCGTDTHEVNGACVADLRCGVGTTLSGIECVAVGGITCGSGTTLSGSTCVASTVSCGAGTMQVGSQCLPSGTPVTCGTGTVLQGSQCVPASAAITCGAGTVQQGDQCVPSGTPITCGANTTQQGNQCVAPTPVTCGTGTTLSGNACVAVGGTGHYEVRVPVTQVPADGYSKIPVFSIGTLASGVPSNEAVVLLVNPSYVGTVSPATFTLGQLGTDSFFTPCSSASSACTGTFEIQLALASAPTTVVASSGSLTLVPPTGVGSPAPCMGSPRVIFFDGDPSDFIHPGTDTITQGTWSGSGSADYLTINATPSNSTQGSWWYLTFSTRQLGQPLAVNVYTMAERAAFASPGHPGIDVSGSGRGCNTITGKFQVHSISWSGSTLTDFLATFEQHCEGGTAALRGCVHYQ